MYINPTSGFTPCLSYSGSSQSTLNLGITKRLHLWVCVHAMCLHAEVCLWCLLSLQCTCILCVCSVLSLFSEFSLLMPSCISFGFCPCIPSFSVAVGAFHSIISCCLALPIFSACCVHLSLRYCPASPSIPHSPVLHTCSLRPPPSVSSC